MARKAMPSPRWRYLHRPERLKHPLHQCHPSPYAPTASPHHPPTSRSTSQPYTHSNSPALAPTSPTPYPPHDTSGSGHREPILSPLSPQGYVPGTRGNEHHTIRQHACLRDHRIRRSSPVRGHCRSCRRRRESLPLYGASACYDLLRRRRGTAMARWRKRWRRLVAAARLRTRMWMVRR